MTSFALPCLCSCILLILISSSAAQDVHQRFESHCRRFECAADAAKRAHQKAAFIANDQMINAHNAKNLSWTMAHNQFSTLTEKEFAAIYLTMPKQPLGLSRKKRAGQTPIVVPAGYVPGTLNLATSAIPVKNQGACGSCWAFAAVATMEYQLYNTYGVYYDLSEQNCVDCARANGCSGGFMGECYDYGLRSGIKFESVYPYTAVTQTCSGGVTSPAYGLLPAQMWTWYTVPADELLMAYIMQSRIRWMAACLDASPLQFYSSGVVRANTCSSSVNHAITLVGFGTDAYTGLNYWLGRNSWGASWGESGYFKIERGVGACGITSSYQGYRTYLA